MEFEKQEEYLRLIEQLKSNLSKYDMSISEFVQNKEIPYFEKAWAITVRKSFDIGTASDEMVLFFREQNMDMGVPMLLWEEWYSLLKEYINRNDLREISKDTVLDSEVKIGLWANRQIREFRKLSIERQNIFLTCGLDLTKLERARDERLEKERVQKFQIEKLVHTYFSYGATIEQISLFEKCVQEILGIIKSKSNSIVYVKSKFAQLIANAYLVDSDVSHIIWKYVIEEQEILSKISLTKEEWFVDILCDLKNKMGEDDVFSLLCKDKNRIEYLVRLRIAKARKLCKDLIYISLNGDSFNVLEEIFSEVCKFYPRDIEDFFENLSSSNDYRDLLIFLLQRNYSLDDFLRSELYLLDEKEIWNKHEFYRIFIPCIEKGYCNIAIQMIWEMKEYLKIEEAIECLELFLSSNLHYRFEVLAEFKQNENYYEWLSVCISNSIILEKKFVEECYNEKLVLYVLRRYLERGEFLLFKQVHARFCSNVYAQTAIRIVWNNREYLTDLQIITALENFINTDKEYRFGILLRFSYGNQYLKWLAGIITKSHVLECIFLEKYYNDQVVKFVIYEYMIVRRIDKIKDLLVLYFRYSFWKGDVDDIWEIFLDGLAEGILSNLDCRKIIKHIRESGVSETIKEALEEKYHLLLFGTKSSNKVIRNSKRIRVNAEKEMLGNELEQLSANDELYLSCIIDTIVYLKKQDEEILCADKCVRIGTEEEAFAVFKEILIGHYCLDNKIGLRNLIKIYNRYWGEKSRASDEVLGERRQCIIDYWAITGACIPFEQLLDIIDGKDGIVALGLSSWTLSEHGNILKSIIYKDYENYVLNSKSFYKLQTEIYNFERYHEIIVMSALIRIRRVNYQAFINIISGKIMFEEERDRYALYSGMNLTQDEILSIRKIFNPVIISGIRMLEQIDDHGEVIVKTCEDTADADSLVKFIARIINRELIAWTEMEGDTKSLFFEFMNSSELQYLSSKTKRLLYVTIMGVITDVIPYVKIGYSNAISDYKSSLSFQEHLKKIESIKRDLQEIITVYEREASEFEGMISFCNEFNETLNKEEVKIREEIVKCFGEEVTLDTISDAKRVLIQNQNRLVVEDETELIFQDEEECEIKLLDMEKKILGILLWEGDKAAEIEKLEQSGVYVGLLVNQINEKAMDKIGDVVICTDGNLSIYEEYLEECEQWYHE